MSQRIRRCLRRWEPRSVSQAVSLWRTKEAKAGKAAAQWDRPLMRRGRACKTLRDLDGRRSKADRLGRKYNLALSQSIGKTSAHVSLIASMRLPWLAPSLWPISANEHQRAPRYRKATASAVPAGQNLYANAVLTSVQFISTANGLISISGVLAQHSKAGHVLSAHSHRRARERTATPRR
jgi:hypothetical protein